MSTGAQSIYTIGGTVQAGSGLYVERAADAELLALCRESAFAYVLTARQMGKSSLMTETAARLEAAGTRTVQIDLTLIGTALGAEQWYLGLATEVADQLELAADPLAWWGAREHLGPAQRLTAFLREVVLAEVAKPIVIFVDEIDTTLSLDFADDFYAAIRALYNARAQQPELTRLAFVLIGVATPGDLIKDPQRTPFNIGRQVQLSDFSSAEAQPFAAGLGLPPEAARAALARVLGWTNGHPYLTQRLCAAVAEQRQLSAQVPNVDALVREIFLGERSKQDNNLQFVRDMLTRRAPDSIGVLTTYRHVRRGHTVRDDESSLVKAHLKLAGVVRREGDVLRVRNWIYARAFNERWVRENLPHDYLPRRLQRVGLLAIAALLVLLLLLGTFLVGSNSRVAELQAAQQTSEARRVQAVAAEARAVDAAATAEARRVVADNAAATAEARRVAADATIHQLMLSDAQAALAEGNLDQARVGALTALQADPQLVQAQSILEQAVYVPSTRLRLLSHTDKILTVAVSPDGHTVIAGAANGKLEVWDLASGQLLRTLEGHTGAIHAIVFSAATQLVSAGDNSTLEVWDLASGQLLRTLDGQAGAIHAIVFSPDGQLVSASDNGTLEVWDVASGQSLITLHSAGNPINAIAFSLDGQLVSASNNGTLEVWDLEAGHNLRTLGGDGNPINLIAFGPGGQLVSAGDNGTLAVWDFSGGQILRTLDGHSGRVNAIAFSADGQLISAGNNGTLEVWDLESGQILRTLKGHNGPINTLAFSADSQILASGSSDRTVRVWAMISGQSLHTFRFSASALNAVAFSANGQTMVSSAPAFDDGRPELWDVASGQPLHALEGNTGRIYALAFSPDGKTLASSGINEPMELWDVASGERLHTLENRTRVVYALAFSPDGKTLASGGLGGPMELWDVASGERLHTLEGANDTIYALAFSPDGKTIVAGARNGTLHIWDVASGEALRTLEGHTGAVYALAFSPDGKTLASGAADSTLRIWDVASGQSLRTLEGHTKTVRAVAFSPDGKTLVSGAADATLRIWDVASGQSLRTLEGHTKTVRAVAFSPGDQTLISSSSDGTLRIWPLFTLNRLIDWTLANRYVPELTAEQRQRYGLASEPAATPRAATAIPAR